MDNFKLKKEIQNIAKIKVTNFKPIENEEMVTNILLLLCLEYIDKYNVGFLPFTKNINGLQNMITCCINLLDDKNMNLLETLDTLIKLKEKDSSFNTYYEEIIEILEDEVDWSLLFSKTFIKIKLYNDIINQKK